MADEWSYNKPDNDLWNNDLYETKEEAEKHAIEYARELGLTEVEIGKLVLLPLPNYVDTEDILNDLNYQYEDEAGGEYDGDLYKDVSEDNLKWLEEELSKVINAFHERAEVKSNWYTVTNIYAISVTDLDIKKITRR